MKGVSGSSIYNDIGALDQLRQQAQQALRGSDESKDTLLKAARQFESFFTQMLFTSMREANQAFEAEEPFNSHYTRFYQGMLDQQMAVEMSEKGSLGLAELMVKQLAPETLSEVLQRPGTKTGSDNEYSLEGVSRGQSSANVAKLPSQIMRFDTPKEFVDSLLPLAKQAAKLIHASPVALLAQAALETGWGQKLLRTEDGNSSFNLFNIKANPGWQGDKTVVSTLEYRDGIAVRERAEFRAYPSFRHSFTDFVSFLTSNPRYQEAIESAKQPDQFIDALQRAGYATDPNYAGKIKRVMRTLGEML